MLSKFDSVDWEGLNNTLAKKADMYGIAHWIPKYLALRGRQSFSLLGTMKERMLKVSLMVDEIDFVVLMYGRIPQEIQMIQSAHL